MPRLGRWTPGHVLAIVLVVAFSLAILAIPEEQVAALQEYGYAGIFLISLLANATIVIPAPAMLLVFAMGAHLSPIGLGLAAGSGAALGELSGYLAGSSGQALIEDNSTYQRLETWVKKYGGFTIFLLAAVPNPVFDLGGIAAGALRMPVLRFLAWCAAGKILRMTVVAMAGAGIFG
ncbi:MAG: VTT domain-containing protein [Anaerolineales bacterium]